MKTFKKLILSTFIICLGYFNITTPMQHFLTAKAKDIKIFSKNTYNFVKEDKLTMLGSVLTGQALLVKIITKALSYDFITKKITKLNFHNFCNNSIKGLSIKTIADFTSRYYNKFNLSYYPLIAGIFILIAAGIKNTADLKTINELPNNSSIDKLIKLNSFKALTANEVMKILNNLNNKKIFSQENLDNINNDFKLQDSE